MSRRRADAPIARLTVVIAVLALVSAGCGGGPSSSPTQASAPTVSAGATPHVSVSLEIYSGRADPSWDLGGRQTAELVARIVALPVAAGTPPQGGLGYHGLLLVLRWAGLADQTLVAYRAKRRRPRGKPLDVPENPGRARHRATPVSPGPRGGPSSASCWTLAGPTLAPRRLPAWRPTSQRREPHRG